MASIEEVLKLIKVAQEYVDDCDEKENAYCDECAAFADIEALQACIRDQRDVIRDLEKRIGELEKRPGLTAGTWLVTQSSKIEVSKV